MDPRSRARQLAAEGLAEGDAVGWFERLYREAAAGTASVPWADGRPNPHLVEWFEAERPVVADALVIGCGLGDDAEWLAARVARVTAFDVSPSAIEQAGLRFSSSSVRYQVADVLRLPPHWRRAFDFVFEAYTLQVLPAEPRRRAISAIASTVADAGTLLVVSRGRDTGDEGGGMPWPLVRSELEAFAAEGLGEVALDDFIDDEDPPVRRFRLVSRR